MYFSGTVNDIVFSKKDQGFYILKILLDDEDQKKSLSRYIFKGEQLVTAKGYVPGLSIQVGSWFGFEGKWVNDEKYGRQLSIIRAPVFGDHIDSGTVVTLLLENGISDDIVYALEKAFAQDLSKFLSDTPRIQEVLQCSDKDAQGISEQWAIIRAHMKTLEELGELGLPQFCIGAIMAVFGDKTAEKLTENPWTLVQIEGVTLSKMDELARKRGLSLESKSRLKAAIILACRESVSNGDLFLRSSQLLFCVKEMVGEVSHQKIADALAECHAEGTVVLDRETVAGLTAVYDPWCHHLEVYSASALQARLLEATPTESYFARLSTINATTAEAYNAYLRSGISNEVEEHEEITKFLECVVQECAAQIGFTLPPEQAEGVLNGILYPISILTGLPGTGKSTSMKVLVRVFQQAQIPCLLMAPTGIAAKRLGSVCNSVAYTIHRALGAKGKDDSEREFTYAGITGTSRGSGSGTSRQEVWGYNENTPHPAQVVVIDECSMVDQHLLYRILSGTLRTTRLVFVGDAAQLPSVGPGNVLRDMITSGKFPTVALTQIFRQEDTSDIVKAAHAIYRGQVPSTDIGSDFAMIHVREEEKILQIVQRLSEKLAKSLSSWDESVRGPAPTFQVLSPRHMGTVGVTNLNVQLRNLLNPPREGLGEVKLGKEDAREQDRVMVVKNNYDLGVYNGDIGTVLHISRKEKRVQVQLAGIPPMSVDFPLGKAHSHLRLAYACTVHKYQGLEVDTVIMPLILEFGNQLQRNLLYTAITRAKKKVILVGSPAALEKAVLNNKEDLRNTLLVARLHTENPLGAHVVKPENAQFLQLVDVCSNLEF